MSCRYRLAKPGVGDRRLTQQLFSFSLTLFSFFFTRWQSAVFIIIYLFISHDCTTRCVTGIHARPINQHLQTSIEKSDPRSYFCWCSKSQLKLRQAEESESWSTRRDSCLVSSDGPEVHMDWFQKLSRRRLSVHDLTFSFASEVKTFFRFVVPVGTS